MREAQERSIDYHRDSGERRTIAFELSRLDRFVLQRELRLTERVSKALVRAGRELLRRRRQEFLRQSRRVFDLQHGPRLANGVCRFG